ncbi:HPr family phosphocarrier protein [Limnohabitans sp.]|jgi:phosphotransferase system HPr (HPr) family protein|uniref:HPr family phosphocarrier protein n=1 Tax=Limnohabitans sp. TaxID=1907725 RepID=UPI0038B80AA9
MSEHTLPITLKLTGKCGLDPRASALLAMQASHFNCDITLACHGHVVNAKSVAEVMSLGAMHDDLVDLSANGEQAQQAVNALIAVIQRP